MGMQCHYVISIYGSSTNIFIQETHWKPFVANTSDQQKYGYLVLGIASLCLQHSCNPPRHTLNQILTHLCINLVPLLFYPLPQLQYPLWCNFMLSQLSLQMSPQMFNEVEGCRLGWP